MKKAIYSLVLLFAMLPLFSTAQDNPREERKVGLSGELGWNSLSGLGLNVTYYPMPQVAVDAGLGFGLQLLKTGVRGRYLFLDKKFTPYVGAGILFAPLSVDGLVVDATDSNGNPISVGMDLNASAYLQGVGGIEYMSSGGFLFSLNLGYALLLNDNVVFLTGSAEIDEEIEQAFNILYGSGIAVGISLGYAF